MAEIGRRQALRIAAAAGAAAVAAPAAAREAKRPSADDEGLLVDVTRCVGCRACQTACKEANQLPPNRAEVEGGIYDAPLDLDGSTKNVIQLARGPGGETAFVKRQCMHCADPACVSVCMAGALHKIAGGVVAYDKGVCVGCRYCQVACPFDVPKFQWHTAVPVIVKCELCRGREKGPACAEVCPRGAVVHGKRGALLAEARRRLAAEPARYVPKVYGESDGGGTNVLYLASQGVPFDALGLPKLPERPLPELSESIQHGIYRYGLAPIALWTAVAVVQLRNRKKDVDASDGREEG
ncbi:MAG TPA: hydrogenase 2 operon protein HybA [Anaeromyxobacter sp.]|nr:hydrogenase 2 operon protein HybA [Anaeromyxobacter sp.]